MTVVSYRPQCIVDVYELLFMASVPSAWLCGLDEAASHHSAQYDSGGCFVNVDDLFYLSQTINNSNAR